MPQSKRSVRRLRTPPTQQTQPKVGEDMKYAQARILPALRPLGVLAITLLILSACSERERIGSGPTEPQLPPGVADVAGSYSATKLIVERAGTFKNLVGEPDTRLDIHLNLDGSVQGQIKIGTDPYLRSKDALVGSWQLRVPNGVVFDFDPHSFLEEIYFQIVSADRLSGEWLGEDVHVAIELQRID